VSTSSYESLIERVHASGKHLVVIVTGGGSGAISALLTVPGASACVLEATVPYAQQALEQWLGGAVDSACSEWTARAMAMAAFERARTLAGSDPHAVRGIGATASLASTRPKRGPHRIHVAWQSAEKTVALTCELVKGQRSRGEEEEVAKRLIVEAIAEACDVEPGAVSNPSSEEPVVRREKQAPAEWSELLLGERLLWEASPTPTQASATESPPTTNSRAATPPAPPLLLPGAFHPFHSGHERMAEVAARLCGRPVTYEMSITNVDKPPLDFLEIDDRLGGLAGRPVWLTRAATFVEKAVLAPGTTFVVGADTIARIGEPHYYGHDAAQRDAAIVSIARQGCRFLVFGRHWDGKFHTLADLQLPASLLALCDEVPEAEFRDDVSSTKLRSGA
jgi:nicotinamide mononucleotide (NMN) deamidase PncC